MAATAALALSACGFGSAESPLEDVASETREARTARVRTTVAIRNHEPVQLIGSVDFGRSRARLISREYGIETLVDGEDAYARYPGMSAWIDAGDEYLRRWMRWGDPLAWMAGIEGAEAVEEVGASRYRARIDGIETELWTDRSGRASRIRYVDGSNARVTIEYTKFGVEAAIAAPDADSVLTGAEHQRRLRRQAKRLLRLSEPE